MSSTILKNLQYSEEKLKYLDNIKGAGLSKLFSRVRVCGWRYIHYQITRKLNWRHDVNIKLFTGEKISLPLNDIDTKYIYLFGILGGPELALTKYIIRYFPENGVFYDIGANYGTYSHVVRYISKKVQIHLFEPQKEVVKYLEKNLAKYNLHINEIALSNQTGTIDFYEGFASGVSGKSSLSSEALARRPEKYHKVTVPTSTLDEYIKEHDVPTFIKLDVEGGEELVLKGAANLLSEYSPTIAMEVWLDDEGKKFSESATALLQGYGYRPYQITDDGDLVSFSFTNDASNHRKYENFIFKK